MKQQQLSQVLLMDELNKGLYTQSHQVEFTLEVSVKYGKLKANVSPLYRRLISGRDVRVVVFQRDDLVEWVQPFYKSSGKATPDRSPPGTWWPFSAQYWEEALDEHFPGDDLPFGWIGKEFWDPSELVWCGHYKTPKSVPAAFLELVKSFG